MTTLETSGHRPRLRALVSDALVFAGRHIRHIKQVPEKLIDATVQPLMFVLLFAYVYGGAIAVQNGSYREYVIAGILIQTYVFGMTGPAISLSTDLTEGVIDRFRSLPTSRAAYLFGQYLAELGSLAITTVVLMVTGLVVGWRIHTGPVDVAIALWLLFLFGSAMIWLGTVLGLVVRTPDSVMGIGFALVFPLTFLSSAFVPMETLPVPLQHLAAWNPVSVVVAAMRRLFGNPGGAPTMATWPLEHPVTAAFLCAAAVLVLAMPAAFRLFRRRTMH